MIALLVAVASLLTGLRAARLWYLGSKVHVMPMWDVGGHIEPVDPERAHEEWIIATQQTIQLAGDYNKRGATWTAASVTLSGVASVLAAWQALNLG